MSKVIVVGNGMVGYKFCEKLRSRSDDVKILCMERSRAQPMTGSISAAIFPVQRPMTF